MVIRYLRKSSRLDKAVYDVCSVTATDFTVEMDIS
jgi:hypothetical protein